MSFVARFAMLVLVVGVAEVYLLVRISASAGLLPTALLCVATGVLGGSLVRLQGLGTLLRIRSQLARGIAPALEIVAGLVLLVVGALLITPGFITDGVGFALLVPRVRGHAARWLLQRVRPLIQFSDASTDQASTQSSGARRHRARIIDIDP